ncbi:uncharacterized protein K452DRAFT_295815 [Aplosporella prunicola CBS 121167]|uniref:Major facilitator superfamily (MFS) profile domain-containing protein n=1 Tax=Aplosporella prunicola CBS 121167 TaxID=1176127 RepID=A0A6A6BM47_9PEZI|nr:uncharacterized protein K452DRAFT_295815 [Aplosporella prunicola CBS 121167]KAF2144354.1 hypothetical protein K452DRAFT_295815 [Aplosporella prunicola CBS 121167]
MNSPLSSSNSTDKQTEGNATSQDAPEWKAGKAEWTIIIVLAFVSLMVSIDATILVPALPSLAVALNGSAADTFWTGTSYLLTQAIFQPFIVALSDAFGRRILYCISLLFFTVGTLICCLANNFIQLLAGRAIQGIGGGGLLSLGLVIMTDIVPLRQRPLYLVVNQMAWAVGTIVGPLLGGLFVEKTTWRWIFYVNFPFCGVELVAAPLAIKLHARRAPVKERLLSTDWVGAVLFIGSTCSFLIGLTRGGTEYPWSSWKILVPMVVGVVGTAATVVWEIYGAPTPFLRLSVFNSPSAAFAYIGATFQGLLMFCKLYYIPFYFETAKDFGPIITGVTLLPIILTMLPTSMIVGKLMTKSGRYRWAIWSGWAITCLGTGLLILLDNETKTYAWILIFIVVGLGHGLIIMSLNIAIQAMAETQDVAYAAAMYLFLRTLGMSIGVAIGGAVFQNMLSKHLVEHSLPSSIAHDAEGFVAVLKTLVKDSAQYQSYVKAFSTSFQNVFQTLTGVAGSAALLSLFIRNYSMDKDLNTEHMLRVRSLDREQTITKDGFSSNGSKH